MLVPASSPAVLPALLVFEMLWERLPVVLAAPSELMAQFAPSELAADASSVLRRWNLFLARSALVPAPSVIASSHRALPVMPLVSLRRSRVAPRPLCLLSSEGADQLELDRVRESLGFGVAYERIVRLVMFPRRKKVMSLLQMEAPYVLRSPGLT